MRLTTVCFYTVVHCSLNWHIWHCTYVRYVDVWSISCLPFFPFFSTSPHSFSVKFSQVHGLRENSPVIFSALLPMPCSCVWKLFLISTCPCDIDSCCQQVCSCGVFSLFCWITAWKQQVDWICYGDIGLQRKLFSSDHPLTLTAIHQN